MLVKGATGANLSPGSLQPSWKRKPVNTYHYDDVIMDSIASQITSLTIVYSTVHSGADQSKHQSSASLAFVWEIHRWPVNFPHKWPVTRKMFPFDDVIMSGVPHDSVYCETNWHSSVCSGLSRGIGRTIVCDSEAITGNPRLTGSS